MFQLYESLVGSQFQLCIFILCDVCFLFFFFRDEFDDLEFKLLLMVITATEIRQWFDIFL